MAFGVPREESGLSGELSRARRAICNQTKAARHSLSATQARISACAKKLDAQICSTVVMQVRRFGVKVSEEYVRGVVHALVSVSGGAVVVVLLLHGSTKINTASDLPRRLIGSGRGFSGWVSRVGDGDGMRVVHAPALRIPGSARHAVAKARSTNSVSVRLAGVDAPECAHFGQPGQAFGEDARRWLDSYVKGERVRVIVHSVDQYHRALASVYKPRRFFLFRWMHLGERNVSVELARAGYATVYEGSNAQFGDAKKKIVNAVETARRRRAGMWAAKGKFETPAQFKRRLRTGAASKQATVNSESSLSSSASQNAGNEVADILRRLYNFMRSLR